MNPTNQRTHEDRQSVKGLAMVLGALSDETYSVEGWNNMFRAVDLYLNNHSLHELVVVDAGKRLEFSFTDEFQTFLDTYNANQIRD